jgi:hypothetical protein
VYSCFLQIPLGDLIFGGAALVVLLKVPLSLSNKICIANLTLAA